jgi:hypothetical protein
MAKSSSDPTTPPPSTLQRRAQQTWESFCEELKRAGEQLIRDDLPLDELDAAEGLRYLSRLVRTGLERHVEGVDPAEAYLHTLCDERTKGFGGDNPDVGYLGASLSSEYVYRLRGDLSRCRYFTLMTTGFDEQGAYCVTGSLDDETLPGWNEGPIEITLAPEGAISSDDGRPRLPTSAATRSLLIRCTFDDAASKDALTLELSRIDSAKTPIRCGFEPVSEALLETARFVRATAATWTSQSAGLRKRMNRLPVQDPERIRQAGGDPNIFYYSAAWAVEETEFLVIRIPTLPECKAWGLQINNVWTESLDYTRAPVHVNQSTAHYDPDGGVTIVVSEQDPGRPNWLCTQGHRSGTANFRLMGAAHPVEVTVEIVPNAGAI